MEENEFQPDQYLGGRRGLGQDIFLEPAVTLGVKNLPASTGDVKDTGSIPGSGGSPGGGHGNQLQYSCLENAMDRGAWWATVYRVAGSEMTEAS